MDLQKLEELLESTLKSMGCALYDVALLKENQQDILRISIKALQGPTSLEVCEQASLLISPLLDVHDFMPSSYTLEVSSMGLERTLTKPRHFALSVGDLVEVRTLEKESFKGLIAGLEGENVILNIEGTLKTFPLSQLKKVKSVFEFGSTHSK
ncbi:COG0779: clustered with transcription termination protein NusA [Helicobacter bizzozeronii CCUG 35545]|uniref:ribosome maturation factor RimP n=1 Tax=Helicobacter bizzozeronii TaxID=56877 RepID=UPI00024E5D2F|nr:ribosome maturation factor RimP [Helicobacter bizzozeronii]CCF80486.1 COG0779: clustered with transcription termination protein NusA [Helicobacter bizzozeronii CCUG 35545]